LIVGDVIDALYNLEKEGPGVAMFFADPKYNIGIDYGAEINDDLPPGEYATWTQHWLQRVKHCLREGGACWALINEPNADMMGQALIGWIGPRINRVIWRETFGQYKEDRFPSGHRHLFCHVKTTDMYGAACDDEITQRTWNPDPIRVESARMKVGDKRAAGPRVPDDVWDVSRVVGNDGERQGWAPTQLRLWPVERAILCSTNPGDLVIDPFLGSGTTAIAALKNDRSFIGIDINGEFVAKSAQRIIQAGFRVDEVIPTAQ
jgi:DNA modification methylase